MSTQIEPVSAITPVQRGPLRSRLGGLALILASLLGAFMIVVLTIAFADRSNLLILGMILAFWVGYAGTNAGRRMRLHDGWEELQRDPRPPIVFLRPFQEDSRSKYNAPLGRYVGADVPTPTAKGKATAEPKIGPVLRRVGPFIAVGKPGERLAPFGAARLYLDQNNWRDAVRFLVDHAAAIVLQPDMTPSTCWELEFVAHEVDPRRILMLVPNPALRPLGYDRVRWLAGQVLPRPLPEDYGACDAFIFDARWTARPLVFGRNPRKALAPFIQQVQQVPILLEKRDALATFVRAVRR